MRVVVRLCLLIMFLSSIETLALCNKVLEKYYTERWPEVSSYSSSNCSWQRVESGRKFDFFRDVEHCYARNEPRNESPKHDYWELVCQLSNLLNFDSMIQKLSQLRGSKRQILFLGDSIMRQQMIVFGCMLDPSLVYDGCLQDIEAHYTECVSCTFKIGNLVMHTFKVGAAFNTDNCLEGIINAYLSLDESEQMFNSSDAIVINQGVHHQDDWKRLEQLAEISADLYRQAETKFGLGSQPAFVWRETTPQHFPTCNGFFDKESRF